MVHTHKATDRATRVECVPKTKRVELAAKTHEENGHFGWDHTRLKLWDKWFWPGMDRDSKAAITEDRKDNIECTHGLVSPLQATGCIHDRWGATL